MYDRFYILTNFFEESSFSSSINFFILVSTIYNRLSYYSYLILVENIKKNLTTYKSNEVFIN